MLTMTTPNNRVEATRKTARLTRAVCAGHGTELMGWKSPPQM
jgi:hypothetical protein